MLREGWDVRNVTTIVPLRPYSSKANILPEQTLGRGLRRITPPGEVDEILTVVEHNAFTSLYQQELSQEGLEIEVVDVDKVPRTTVTIYPDPSKARFNQLEIELPQLAQEYRVVAELKGLGIDHVRLVGEDVVATELLLPRAHRLRPYDLGALLAAGHTTVSVKSRPRVGIIPTGDELIQPGEETKPGAVIDFNSTVLASFVREWGGAPIKYSRARDDMTASSTPGQTNN